ncbi:DNA-binding protein [Undibacterium pigrum]|uniref:Gp16 family phage-associated protein n=1 Tax=Undibacterium pigrum TaxID=401470 RepID=A0A318J640_9BURK|nr:DNA-binding protein [Undibacterium pigrum]PXX44272.1 gp16 family phage-associated protein [Undibacterium pigrum]
MNLSQAAIDAVKQRFFEQGICIGDWARAHEFDAFLVYAVLSGRAKAKRGESHRIAVALGLKPPPELSNTKALQEALFLESDS